jgi:DNA-binding transcriptional MerR regulator
MERIAQTRAIRQGVNATALTEGERAMNGMSSLNYSTGASGSSFEEEGDAAHDSAQGEMTISQMARAFSVSLRTLRFYEDRGLIKPRREGNARYYREADRLRMEMILKGKRFGFTLTEIQDLIGGKGTTETPDLEGQLNPHQIDAQIVHLERQRSEIESAIERLRATQSRLVQGVAA